MTYLPPKPVEPFTYFIACDSKRNLPWYTSSMFKGRCLYLFHVIDGKPSKVNTYEIVDGWCDVPCGPITVQDSAVFKFKVGSAPVSLAPGIEIWVPSVAAYLCPLEGLGNFRMSGVAIRSQFDPDTAPVEGAMYLVARPQLCKLY